MWSCVFWRQTHADRNLITEFSHGPLKLTPESDQLEALNRDDVGPSICVALTPACCLCWDVPELWGDVMHTGEVKLDYLCVEEVTFRGTVFHTSTSWAAVRKQTLHHINRDVWVEEVLRLFFISRTKILKSERSELKLDFCAVKTPVCTGPLLCLQHGCWVCCIGCAGEH